MRPMYLSTLLTLAAALLLPGCGRSNAAGADSTEIIPRVKTQVVRAGGEARKRTLVGEVQPEQVWNLAFPVPGRVMKVTVAEGDRVRQGQVLATIDPLVYELKVKNAEAELQSSASEREEKRDALAARTKLRDQGFMAGGMLDRYRVDYTVAQQRVSNGDNALALAKRDLAGTRLVAPANGVISARTVEPFTDVNTGQAVLRLDGGNTLRVAIRVPDRLMADMAIGTPVTVLVADRKLAGKVVRIDARAAAGDSFPVYVSLQGDTTGIRSGVTARVDFVVKSAGAQSTTNIRVPLASVLPGDAPGQGYMFVLQPEGTRVKRVAVRIQAVNDDDAEIAQGLAAGDEIVTAGVAFLSDGQPVRRMNRNPQ
jgi:membrane fusion protein, multidrug efflux system